MTADYMYMKTRPLLFVVVITTIAMLAAATTVRAATPPVKLVLSTSRITSGFEYPEGVAVNEDPTSPEDGYVYVTDRGNHRVQEFTGSGVFVAMFGWEVNATDDKEAGASQSEKNVCTAKSGDTCQVGVEGSAAGQFGSPGSIAVDPASGDVYTAESVTGKVGRETTSGERIQKFTAEGQFVLEVGKEVNETKDKESLATGAEKNVCTEEEVEKASVECGGPAQGVLGSSEHAAFDFGSSGHGDLLAVGGPKDLVYIGEEHRVQEIDTDGAWEGEIPLTSISAEPNSAVAAMALDQETGEVYLTYRVVIHNSKGISIEEPDIVWEFNSEDGEAGHFSVSPEKEDAEEVAIQAIALDPSGHLAVSVSEESLLGEREHFGVLYDTASGQPITEFTIPAKYGSNGIAFSDEGHLYAVITNESGEIFAYSPEPVAALETGAAVCKAGTESETSDTFNCTLKGEVNPYAVPDTEVWFEWGGTCTLGAETIKQPVNTVKEVNALVEGLRPNRAFCYRLVGVDQNVLSPERLTGDVVKMKTPVVPPKIIGKPKAQFVTSSSAVLFGELNPENTGTESFFEYAPEYTPGEETLARCPGVIHANCPGVATTTVMESKAYGKVGTTEEARSLRSGTLYRYRLDDDNLEATEAELHSLGKGEVKSEEGEFTTTLAPEVRAETGPPSLVTATSAIASGTVYPGGQAATYTFELGVDSGASTQYGVVFSGPVGAGVVPVVESLQFTGLQPGTAYAYRIKIASGYGTATGEAMMFTTAGSPSVIEVPTSLATLGVPGIVFPKEVVSPVVKTSKKKTKKSKVMGKKDKHKRSNVHKRRLHKVKK